MDSAKGEPLMNQYDIIVVGGGISGAMAAIAAARCGGAVLVVEQYGFLGGMLTAAGVGPMMTFHAGEEQVIQGLTGELIERLVARGKSPGHIFDTTGYTYTVTPFDAEAMKQELEAMLLDAGGELLFHTMMADASVEGGIVTGITVCNKGGLSDLTAKVYVDATGDADLAFRAGVECTKGRACDNVCQPMTMNMRMVNVEIEAIKQYVHEHPEEFPGLKGDASMVNRAPRLSLGGFVSHVVEAEAHGDLSFKRGSVLFFETNTTGEVIVNMSRMLGFDATDPKSLSWAEVEGRRQVREIEAFLRARVPGFQNAVLVSSGPAVGVRSSRQIKGMYTLTVEDVLSSRIFDDAIAHSGYPVDIHNPDMGVEYKHLCSGEIYSIPYRCLVNARVCNLVTVGRCISATFEAQSAIRITPTVGAIGHAGGVAAYLVARDNVAAVNISIGELQEVLKRQGAYLRA